MRDQLQLIVVGALFDFGAYLTTRPESETHTYGAAHPTPPMVDQVKAFCELRGLPDDGARVGLWVGDTVQAAATGQQAALDAEHAALWRFMLRAVSEDSPERKLMDAMDQAGQLGGKTDEWEMNGENVEATFRAGLAEWTRREELAEMERDGDHDQGAQ